MSLKEECIKAYTDKVENDKKTKEENQLKVLAARSLLLVDFIYRLTDGRVNLKTEGTKRDKAVLYHRTMDVIYAEVDGVTLALATKIDDSYIGGVESTEYKTNEAIVKDAINKNLNVYILRPCEKCGKLTSTNDIDYKTPINEIKEAIGKVLSNPESIDCGGTHRLPKKKK